MAKAKPFVKWAGGKSKLLSQIEALLPADFEQMHDITYIDPFVGGGAMLFHMIQYHKNIRRAVINDINEDLIHCYRLIKDDPSNLLRRLKSIEDEYYHFSLAERKSVFYSYRDKFNNNNIDSDERAAVFIFLNHTCYNGLFRVNTLGQFNVPFGRYKQPIICNKEGIQDAHRVLNSIDVIIRTPGDYQLTRKNLSKRGKNFIYFDPPYRPLSSTSNFAGYSNSPFGDKQQEELKLFCDQLSENGCMVMLSNSDSKNEDGSSYFEGLFDEKYNISRIIATRTISSCPDKRVKLPEVLIRNFE